IRQPFLTGSPFETEFELEGPAGHLVFNWRLTPDFGADGKVNTVLAVARDITQRKLAEAALKEREQYQRAVLDNFPFMVWLKDTESRLLAANQAYADVAGLPLPNDLVGKTDLDLFPAEDAEHYRAGDLEVLDSGKPKTVEEPLFSQGRTIWMETYKSPVTLDGKTIGTVGFARDISDRKHYQQQLEHIAHYDTLTGLPNRVLLADRLQQAMRQVQRHDKKVAVAYLDLDGFKAVNDQYGHDVGDQLLTSLAGHMKRALREGDTLARLGGDEFVAILLDLPDVETTVPMLSRLLAAANEVFHKDDHALRVSASLGVTFYPQAEPIDADQLLRQADQAMYQAKLAGKNRYRIFDADHDRSVRGHHESLERIRQALHDREFVLHYQPKVNMRTGEVIGAEALIRWRHPERGLLSPGNFLPLITDHPLAIPLGEWVLDTAMQQVEDWKAAGLSLPISVNIDAIQLEQADFVDRLRQQVAAHPGLVPGDLELEVLESSALKDFGQVSRVIQACHEIGVGFALDDFGTGY
ncbi:MAG: diguanylate cyclase, partial [Gammaproteobacteria bacterium]|nr:diguanylate cyclase [Gammaproteobacteria bacterium]